MHFKTGMSDTQSLETSLSLSPVNMTRDYVIAFVYNAMSRGCSRLIRSINRDLISGTLDRVGVMRNARAVLLLSCVIASTYAGVCEVLTPA